MRKALAALDPFFLIFFASLAAVAVFFGASQDALLFKSDPASLLGFLASLGLLASLALGAAVACAWPAAGRPGRERVESWLSLAAFSVLQAGFANFLIQLFLTIRSPALYGSVLLGTFAACLAASARLADRRLLRARMRPLARASALLSLALLAGIRAGNAVRSFQARPAAPNVVMIVLDGMSLAPFLASGEDGRSPARRLAAEGAWFSGMRSNKVWTAGWFPTLYSGRKDGRAGADNLWSRLQGLGVRTMWIAFHNDGTPDAFEFPYRGLRSSFLTQHTAPLARLLGLDDNLFLYYRPGGRGKAMGARQELINGLLASAAGPVSLLGELVPEEIERLRAGRRPFFLLIHADASAGEASAAGIWEEAEAPEWARARKEVVDADYAYGPSHRGFVSWARSRYERSTALGLKALLAFYGRYRAAGWDEDTVLIVTSDHGSMASEGRLWYGFHPQEEVARVPFFLFMKGLRGEDRRLAETVDIPATLLDLFGDGRPFGRGGRSLLKPPGGKSLVTSATRPSSLRQECFLSVYTPEAKYRFNIADGTGQRRRVSGLKDEPAGAVPARSALPFDLKALAAEYGVE